MFKTYKMNELLKVIAGGIIILAFLILGKAIQLISNAPIPGSVLGLLLLFTALSLRLITLNIVQPSSDILLKYMALFFVPAGVGLISYLDILIVHGPAIIVSSLVSTIIVLISVGLSYQRIHRDKAQSNKSSKAEK